MTHAPPATSAVRTVAPTTATGDSGATYHRATQPASLARRVRGRPVVVIAAVMFVALIVLLVWSSRPQDYTPMSTNNSTPTGTRAVAQILRAQGVDVRQPSSLAGARVQDPQNTTVVVANAAALVTYQIEALQEYPGDLVILEPSQRLIDYLAPGLTLGNPLDSSLVNAQCDNPDAVAAKSVRVIGSGISGNLESDDDELDGQLCFPNDDGRHAYAVIDDGDRSITIIASSDLVTNARLAEDGNAALALHALGKHPTVVWTMGDAFDPSTLTWYDPNGAAKGDRAAPPTEIEANPDFLPPGTGSALYVLAITVVIAAWWRARRFGPLVREPLPVIVRASEATRGRARLYRRARASGRATAALRGAAALRMARRLGVPRAAGRETLVPVVARAAGRSPADVERILYGPPPADDTTMMTIIEELDKLESEVHHT